MRDRWETRRTSSPNEPGWPLKEHVSAHVCLCGCSHDSRPPGIVEVNSPGLFVLQKTHTHMPKHPWMHRHSQLCLCTSFDTNECQRCSQTSSVWSDISWLKSRGTNRKASLVAFTCLYLNDPEGQRSSESPNITKQSYNYACKYVSCHTRQII